MGLFSKFKDKKIKQYITDQFKVINGYVPAFSSFKGGIYEMELTRSAINSIATQCSKLNPVIKGNYKHKRLSKMLQSKPNYLMTTQQFLERLFTILMCENNAFIIPVYSDYTATQIVGFYPVRSKNARIEEYEGVDYLIYKIQDEERIIEYDRVGHLRKHYYTKEFFGEDNSVMYPTMDLLNMQNEGIEKGISNGAAIRFLARTTNTILPEHLKKERQALTEANLSADNNGGIMIFDNKYSDVKEITSKPFIVDSDQMNIIKSNVFNYFHISEKIIQNTASEDEWNAFYEGTIEPLAIQLGQVLTNMLMDPKDIEKGYCVVFEASKLQFASNKTKLEFVTQMFDRGQLTVNQGLAVFNMAPVEGGDKRYIRKEYTEVNKLDEGGDSDEKDDRDNTTNTDERKQKAGS